MSYRIAVTGKGGVGKTSIAGLCVQRLIARGCRPVLAVDADPNTNLDAALGLKAEHTVGESREQARELASDSRLTGASKQEFLERKISESLIESDDFDLIAMGRPEGPGCYCYANMVLKEIIAQLSSQYPYVVLDNEAGLENLSRRIVQRVDLLLLVSDPSKTGLQTAGRLHALASEMQIEYGRLVLVVNRLRGGEIPRDAFDLQRAVKAEWLVGLPDDESLAKCAEQGLSLKHLTENNAVVERIDDFLKRAEIPQ
jgi:CO dehydrogenase maturation factor